MINHPFQFRPCDIPEKPGVYIYRDRFGTVIYVGKAVNLRRRMSHYFQSSRQQLEDPKFRSLVKSIAEWSYQIVKNEDEALLLESQLIKRYMPRFNILLRDDKQFWMIRIDPREPFPKLALTRFNHNDGARYFGPFPHGTAVKETVIFLNRFFKLRSCKKETPDINDYKHCLAAVVRDCSSPCIQKVTQAQYQNQVVQLLKILEGDISELEEKLKKQMQEAALKQNFEKAAHFRDVLSNLHLLLKFHNRSFINAKLTPPNMQDALLELKNILQLPSIPSRIEGFDNSHFAGQLPVSSMVCFIDGKPSPQNYRRFRNKFAKEGVPDDYLAMAEVIARHYLRKIKEKQPLPDLILIDGGKGQLHVAQKVLNEIGLSHIPILSIAKRQEELFLPNQEKSIQLTAYQPAQKLIQAIRDEAHRFAIEYNRLLRNQRIQESWLDDIEGIGKQRKIDLLSTFGSVREILKKNASEIHQKVPSVPLSVAEKMLQVLKRKKSPNTDNHSANSPS